MHVDEPGITVRAPRSITVAPFGTFVARCVPEATIVPPSTTSAASFHDGSCARIDQAAGLYIERRGMGGCACWPAWRHRVGRDGKIAWERLVQVGFGATNQGEIAGRSSRGLVSPGDALDLCGRAGSVASTNCPKGDT